MNHTIFFLADSEPGRLMYVWGNATIEAKVIIVLLIFFSIFAWSVMAAKALQMRRAKQLNELFEAEFRASKTSFGVHDRNLNVEGCPLYTVYKEACIDLDARLSTPAGRRSRTTLSVKKMEHVKRTMERVVAQQALRLESGLILLAIAVSGGPFLGLLGTVWGVMDTFSGVAIAKKADLTAMAPGVSAALITTVAGLLVAIPSMFGYNWLVHNLRVQTVTLDNFAQELASRMETEYLKDDSD